MNMMNMFSVFLYLFEQLKPERIGEQSIYLEKIHEHQTLTLKLDKKGNPGIPIVNSIDSIRERLLECMDENIKSLSKLVQNSVM